MRRLIFAGLALTAACGGKHSTPVTDQGKTLTPKSSVAAVGTVLGFIPITEVIVADVDSLCDKFGGINACNPGASSPTSTITSGSLLELAVIANATGDFQAGDPSHPPTDGGGGLFGVAATVEFLSVGSGQSTVPDVSVSGVVHLTSVKVGGSAEGSYDVTMQSGAHLVGDFHGDACPAFTALLTTATSTGNQCNQTGSSSTSCSESCTCGGKTVGASCSQFPDAGAWDCTCTGSSGATTTCTMPANTFSSEACSQGQSCCPLSF